jgi:hypothetical protein
MTDAFICDERWCKDASAAFIFDRAIRDCSQCQKVAFDTQSAIHPGGRQRHQRIPILLFTLVDVGDVHLDQRLVNQLQRVEHRNRSKRELD